MGDKVIFLNSILGPSHLLKAFFHQMEPTNGPEGGGAKSLRKGTSVAVCLASPLGSSYPAQPPPPFTAYSQGTHSFLPLACPSSCS